MLWLIAAAAIIAFLVFFFRLDADITGYFAKIKNDDFKGQVIWIIGASSGIGEELAYLLARNGARLVLSARREAELVRVKNSCQNADQHVVFPLDATKFATHDAAVQQVLETVGHVDRIVLNMGRTQRALAVETNLDVTMEMLEFNTLSAVSLARAIMPHFLARKSGHFVITSSVAGKVGAPISSSYSLTKWALHGYFEAIRAEQGSSGVDVTFVCPGPVDTPISDNAFTHAKGAKNDRHEKSGSKMSVQRCVHLMAAAMANRSGEVWISQQPILFFVYLMQYAPNVARWLSAKLGGKRVQAFKSGLDVNSVGSWFSRSAAPAAAAASH